MKWLDNLKDASRRKKARAFAQELSNQFFLSPMCSDYENLFAQVRPLIDEMKTVMPYGVTERGKKLPESQTPELYWLKNPNDEMGWAEFADVMFATWLTEDELDIHCWWNKSHTRVIGYTILPPQSRIYLGYGQWEWQVQTTEGIKMLTEDEVLRLRFSRSPRNIQKGVSPASAVRVWAQIDDLISQYQRAYFENGAIPATITFITASTEEKYIKTREELERKLKGAQNRNKTVYAWRQFDNDSGNSVDQIEVKTIQGNNSTLAIKDIVSIINDRLNKSVGVSNFILGDDSSAKYDNAELSDHQFTKRRVYPALMSFWNQFQHELDRVTGGLGYGISFDLEIPELTERERAKAEIARIKTETLVNIISAGASAQGAIDALELPENWIVAAQDIYAKGQAGELKEPIPIDYKLLPSPISGVEVYTAIPTIDGAEETEKKEYVADVIHGHSCTCHHTLDELPPMTDAERELYEMLVELGDLLIKEDAQEVDLGNVIEKMTQMLESAAQNGEIDSAEALKLLTDEDVANEITNALSKGEIFVSDSLKDRLAERARLLVNGYADYTRQIIEETLTNTEGMTANEIAKALSEVMPKARAELIARNETVYAIKSGRLEQDESLANRYGLNIKLVWRTSHDSKVCPVCAAMDGETVDLGKAFADTIRTSDGEILSWEHSTWNDNGRIPDAHPNCRCYFDEVLV